MSQLAKAAMGPEDAMKLVKAKSFLVETKFDGVCPSRHPSCFPFPLPPPHLPTSFPMTILEAPQ